MFLKRILKKNQSGTKKNWKSAGIPHRPQHLLSNPTNNFFHIMGLSFVLNFIIKPFK
jgi:hypothetical protein